MGHNNTLSIVRRKHALLSTADIRPTEAVGHLRNPWKLPDVPIVVVKRRNRFFIVDGNHRFTADSQRGCTEVKAWVLAARDRKLLSGTLTGKLQAFRDREITLAELAQSAAEACEDLA